METQVAQLKHQASLAYDRRDYQSALELFQRILARHPEFADIRHCAGLCQSFLGRPEAALAEFDRALEANPAYVEAHINRALTLNELGRYEEARAAFEQAGRYEQESEGQLHGAATAKLANAHAGVGDLYAEAGAHELAVQQYRQALELRPHFQDIRNKLAQSLLQLGETEAAAAELRGALDGNPHFLAARINLGLAYYRLGRPAEALREWRSCEQQDRAHPQVRAYLAMLSRHGEEGNAG